MTRRTSLFLVSLLALAGCGAPQASRAAVDQPPTATRIQRTWVIPHVLERDGRINSADLEKNGYAVDPYVECMERDPKTGESRPVRLPFKLLSFEIDINETLEATLTVDAQDEAYRRWGEAQDCDDGDTRCIKQITIRLTRDGEWHTIRLTGPVTSQRTVGAGVVTDVIEFAGMAINEQGIPSKKKAKKAN